MNYKHNPKLTPCARLLRRRMTDEERRLWYTFLKQYPIRFLRQKVIDNYVVDFYCRAAGLVIELDGSQHYEDKGIVRDRCRDEVLQERGLMVLHIPNRHVNEQFAEVCGYIDLTVQQRMNR